MFGVGRCVGTEKTSLISLTSGRLAGVLRIGFGTYFEAFMLAGLLCIAAALMVLFIGTGRRGVAEPATAKAYS